MMKLLWLFINLVAVYSEEVFFNGTHRIVNQTNAVVEVTTVKIAEIVNIKTASSANTTIVLRVKTAKHFMKPTTMRTKLVLIPPARIGAQIIA